jgi:hypothetical protein
MAAGGMQAEDCQRLRLRTASTRFSLDYLAEDQKRLAADKLGIHESLCFATCPASSDARKKRKVALSRNMTVATAHTDALWPANALTSCQHMVPVRAGLLYAFVREGKHA